MKSPSNYDAIVEIKYTRKSLSELNSASPEIPTRPRVRRYCDCNWPLLFLFVCFVTTVPPVQPHLFHISHHGMSPKFINQGEEPNHDFSSRQIAMKK
jgi:hypothetical protein